MASSADQKTRQLYEFGPFRVDPEKELLLRDQETIPLAPKAFQVLLVLVRHRRQVVTKDDLLKAVWPDTFVEEANLSRNIFLLRKALGEGPQDHQYIVTVPGRGYRFAEDVQTVPERELDIIAASHSTVQVQVKEARPWGWITAAAVVLVALAVGAFKLFLHRTPVLTEKDTVVLADFINSTQDPVFDETLRQGLAVDLEQSPFLSLIPDQRIQRTLRLMGQPADTRLTPPIAHDVCQRTQSAAYVSGSIASLGTQYVIGLKAVSCVNGNVLAQEQETTGGKERILKALDTAAEKLRQRLGESLSTVEKFDTPLEQATTPSLEALQAYTLGRRTQAGKDQFAASVPFYQRAIQFDPNFSIAYAALGVTYHDLGESLLGTENLKKAYELRTTISETERFYVESAYYQFALGDLDKAHQIYEIWGQIYPRNSSPRIRLCELYGDEGRYEDALPQIREAIRLDPLKGVSFRDLVRTLIDLNRFQETGAAAQQAIAQGLGSVRLRLKLYQLAFLENDAPGMARQVESVAGDADGESQMQELEAQTSAYYGHLKDSRDFSRLAVESAMRAKESENANGFEANAALQEALFGNIAKARSQGGQSSGAQAGKSSLYAWALTFALAGESLRAQSMADELAKRYPDDTLVQFNFLPTVRAQIALIRRDPATAVDLLQSAAPYELSDLWWGFLGPVYVRGQAFLLAGRGADAAREFQKIVDHRGIVGDSPIGALAHLRLGRAYSLMQNRAQAKNEYQQFLTLWNDADPDIPILLQARSEYGKLQ